jgi:membrane fusion protein (multidrug efflux system)
VPADGETPAAPAPDEAPPPLFRAEALAYLQGPGDAGAPLRLTPRWTQVTFWLLLLVFLSFVAYAVLGSMDEYAQGIAVIRMDGRTELTARQAGTIESVEVQPGQRVKMGQVLVRFHGDVAALQKLEESFDAQLVKALASPNDEGARAALISARAERDLARARIEEGIIRATREGVVGDVRIRPGQLIQAGETVATLVPDEASFVVTAILPGQYRPRLKPGMPLRIEMTGYHYAYREVPIEAIGDEIVGPTEIRRTLGQELADTLPIGGPVVLVTARLPTRSFKARDREYDYYEGMQGRAEARVGHESVAVALIPGLKAFLE